MLAGLKKLAHLIGRTPGGATDEALRATWIGGPTLLFRFGPITIVTDPVRGACARDFKMTDAEGAPIKPCDCRIEAQPRPDLAQADLVLLSDAPSVAFDPNMLSRLSHVPFLVPLLHEKAVRDRGVRHVLGLPWRASHVVRREGYSVRITAIPAQHGARAALLKVLGGVNGYWLDFRHAGFRRTIYWTGTAFPVPAEYSGEIQTPDLLVSQVDDMNSRDAIALARAVSPKAVLPIDLRARAGPDAATELSATGALAARWKIERLKEGGELLLS